MKIVIATDIPLTFVCGSSYFIKRLSKRLAERGHEIMFIVPSQSIRNELHKDGNITIFGIRSLPAILQKNLRLSPPIAISNDIEKAIKDFGADVVHTHSHFTIPYVALKVAKKLGVPSVATNHFVPENVFYHFHPPEKLETFIKKIGWKHLHKVLELADVVTTPTKTAAGLLTGSGFKKPVQAISNGIDLKTFFPGQDGKYLNDKYALPNKPRILFVGRLDPEKNVDYVIEAMPAILKEVDAEFLIAGRGAVAKDLQKLAEKLNVNDNVKFVGFVPDEDLPKLYNVVDLFVMPGTAELQSLVTMEAMATKLPVVAVDAMALPELVHDGENGYLFADHDIKTLAEKITAILKDKELAGKMGEAGFKIIQAHDVEKVMDAWEAVYKEAAISRGTA